MAFGRIVNKKLENEQMIFEAGMKLFHEKGFSNTTMQDISELAGVSKSTVFNYFPTKEDLLLKFGRNQVKVVKEFAKNLPLEMEIKSKILAVLFEDLSGVENAREHARIQLTETYKYDWIYTLEAQNRKDLASVYEQILLEGQGKNEISSCVDCEHVAGLIVAFYFHALYTGVEAGEEIDIRDYFVKSLEILWNGINDCSGINSKEKA